MKNLLLVLMTPIIFTACSTNNGNSQNEVNTNNVYKGDPVGLLTRIEANGRYGYEDEMENIIVEPIYNNLPDRPCEIMNVKSGMYRG